MASGDIYEVTDVQSLYGQEVLNVYFYEQRGAFVPIGQTTAQALADEWVDTVIPLLTTIQTGDCSHIEVRVRNLFDATDQGLAVAGTAGSSVADTLPGYCAWGFGLKTDNASIRDGAKRIAGVGEDAQTDGVALVGFIDELNDVADFFSTPITAGVLIPSDLMFPVVVKRVRSGTPGNYTYRLPETSGEAIVGTIIETLVNVVVTSQVSRKLGVGI